MSARTTTAKRLVLPLAILALVVAAGFAMFTGGDDSKTLTAHFVRAGSSSRRAGDLATLLLATLEGAHVLCRADGTIKPFDRAAAALRQR